MPEIFRSVAGGKNKSGRKINLVITQFISIHASKCLSYFIFSHYEMNFVFLVAFFYVYALGPMDLEKKFRYIENFELKCLDSFPPR